ncbi:RepA [Chicken associated gemycircularvirus 2]|uniref:RepA n=1 Tax=Chicken associated gemycircularvirus 2 TaxID=1985377 RepID=A0A168MG03_9VIRU|nr:RepA [Faeces associated gemycircularvirus 17]ANC51576.1 RepA [Faeces associated gemycircularvirus 17]
MPATSLLHTRSAVLLMSGPLTTILDLLERSVSWDEKFMLMEVLISMFSAISAESFDPDEPISLMCRVITQTSSDLKETLERVRVTQQKMETLSPVGSPWNPCPLRSFQALKIRGLRSSAAKVERNFMRLLTTSVRGISSPDLEAFTHTPSGSGLRSAWATNVPPGSCLAMELFLTWLATEREFWMYEVSGSCASTLCAHGPSPPGASSPGGGPRASLESRARWNRSILGVLALTLISWKSENPGHLRSSFDR